MSAELQIGTPSPLRPLALLPSRSTIAVATPASSPKEKAALESGIAFLQSMDFTVVTGRLDFPADGYLSGSDEARAAEFNSFIRNPEVDAIFCTRGGYGAIRILPLIDYDAAAQHCRLLVGYSDITALQLALFKKANWMGVSGPMVAVEWKEGKQRNQDLFWRLVSGSSLQSDHDEAFGSLTPVIPGDASGVLLGGNLAVILRLIGTPYLPDLSGAILFIEDVNEPAYKIDGMLAQLKLAGIWEQLGGLVIGQFTDEANPQCTSPEIMAVFQEYCNNVNFPVASGLRYGHIPVKYPIPIGIQARLHVTKDSAALSILEPLVANLST